MTCTCACTSLRAACPVLASIILPLDKKCVKREMTDRCDKVVIRTYVLLLYYVNGSGQAFSSMLMGRVRPLLNYGLTLYEFVDHVFSFYKHRPLCACLTKINPSFPVASIFDSLLTNIYTDLILSYLPLRQIVTPFTKSDDFDLIFPIDGTLEETPSTSLLPQENHYHRFLPPNGSLDSLGVP